LKRVLIISPHFPPANAADHQRVRMCLPYLAENGWQASVVAVRPEQTGAVRDEWLSQTIPDIVPVAWADAWPPGWTRRMGFGQLAYRAWGGVRRAAESLLKRERFDLVFFSTTQFPFLSLGPRWLKQFGVPFVLDIQDPWWSDYYQRNPGKRPPGGRLRYGFANGLARRQEGRTVPRSAHVVCVSDAYANQFRERYPEMAPDRFTTLPFGAPERDFEILEGLPVRQTLFDPSDGLRHWVFVGAAGHAMAFAVRSFFGALKLALPERPELARQLRIHFAGTDYAPPALARKSIEPLAREAGVEQMVSEQTDRLPYFETLRCLREADALIMLGSDDPSYTASRIYPYILARKPLLAVFHKDSSVIRIVNETRAGVAVAFGDHRLESVAEEIRQRWFGQPAPPAPATDWEQFAPYTAQAMTARLCEVFDRAVGNRNG
jgi:hypothetical protein